jgi:hypothetical protein
VPPRDALGIDPRIAVWITTDRQFTNDADVGPSVQGNQSSRHGSNSQPLE